MSAITQVLAKKYQDYSSRGSKKFLPSEITLSTSHEFDITKEEIAKIRAVKDVIDVHQGLDFSVILEISPNTKLDTFIATKTKQIEAILNWMETVKPIVRNK